MEELKRMLRKFSRNYGDKGREVAEAAERLLAEGMVPEEAIKEAFRLCGVEEWLSGNVETLLIETAQSALPEEAVSLITAEELLRSLATPWDGSGMTLSEKLHGTAEDMRKRISDTVKDQLRRNRNIRQIAEALYDGYHAGHVVRQQQLPQYIQQLMALYRRSKGNLSNDEYDGIMKQLRGVLRQHDRLAEDGASYNHFRTSVMELVTAILEQSDKAVQNALWAAAQEKSRYAAERIARTEGARAYYDAFMAQYEADDAVAAFQWKKSSRHPVFDICDLYADADLYGLGKGVFPKDKAPGLPAHPHCLCHYSLIYASELEGKTEKDDVQAGGAKYLKTLTERQRESLLGVKGAQEYMRDGDWQKYARGWRSGVKQGSRIILPRNLRETSQNGIMILPRYKEAVMPEAKFTKYALDPTKGDGGKAKGFKEALGYDLSNWRELAEQIRINLPNYPAVEKGRNSYGISYEVRMNLIGPIGKNADVITAWIDDSKTGEMRLVSAYVKKRKRVINEAENV